MKLRIKGNSIRLRLGRSEVAMLVEGRVIEESTVFDPEGRQRLTYRLISDPEATEVVAIFDAGCVTVRLPVALTIDWGMTDRIGIEASQPIAGGTVLRILIEKDLECLDAPPEESQADAFPRSSHGLECASAIEENGLKSLGIGRN
jgi:hypothetical protein